MTEINLLFCNILVSQPLSHSQNDMAIVHINEAIVFLLRCG